MTGLGQTRRVLSMHRKKCPESFREIKSVAVAKRMLLCLSTKETMEDDHTSAAERGGPGFLHRALSGISA